MREIQVTEAKARLAELLRVVEHGETVAITGMASWLHILFLLPRRIGQTVKGP